MPARELPLPPAFTTAESAAAIARIADSFSALLGRELVPDALADRPALALWHAPQVILAHGVEDDPRFFFGNQAALAAFECDITALIGMPSRLSAEPGLRAERQALLDRVSRQGFIDDYAGIRISAQGRRFSVTDAVVWNLIDGAGHCHGQAACFAAPAHAAGG